MFSTPKWVKITLSKDFLMLRLPSPKFVSKYPTAGMLTSSNLISNDIIADLTEALSLKKMHPANPCRMLLAHYHSLDFALIPFARNPFQASDWI